jgi:LacI family transcriptional regulator
MAAEPRIVRLQIPPDTSFGLGIMLGICDVVASDDVHVVATDDPTNVRFRRTRPEVWVCTEDSRRQALALAAQGRPVVCCEYDLTAQGIPSVLCDHRAIAEAAARHFMERGFRSFAGWGISNLAFSRERLAAFMQTVRAAGGTYHLGGESHIAGLSHGRLPGQMASLRRWLLQLPKPTAFLATCDTWARQLTTMTQSLGFRVPEDFAIIGVANEAIYCETGRPTLSSVAVSWRQLGRQVGIVVQRLLKGEKVPAVPILIPPDGVIMRRSTDVTLVPDENVAAALAFIRRRASDPIAVIDVLRAVPVRRRSLEDAFRRYVGHGVMREIRRVRVEEAKRLLLLGTLPISEVAWLSGFANARKLAAIFANFTGETPSGFRTRHGAKPTHAGARSWSTSNDV